MFKAIPKSAADCHRGCRPVDEGYAGPMKVIMVKKRLADGTECKKCREASEFLQKKGVFDQIDDIVWFDESDPQSPGATLAEQHAMERAPFFIVQRRGKPDQAIDSVMRVYRML